VFSNFSENADSAFISSSLNDCCNLIVCRLIKLFFISLIAAFRQLNKFSFTSSMADPNPTVLDHSHELFLHSSNNPNCALS